MTQHQKKQLLNERGFVEIRKVRHGTLYRNATGDTIILARPGTKDTRAEKNWLQEMKRIDRKNAAVLA